MSHPRVEVLKRHGWGDCLPTLGEGRVRLRAISDADAPALFEIFGDREVARYWSRPAMTEARQALELAREIRVHFAEKTLFQWGIVRAGEQELIGTTTLFSISEEHLRAEIGFALARREWGQGLMREALRVLIDFAFGELGLERLEADIDPRNARSIRAVEQQGFRYEGLLRERYRVGGEVQDTVFYGLLRRERG